MTTIVVGVDGSERAPVVLEAARLMAERLGAKVVLVSAIEGLDMQAMIPPELAAWTDPTLWSEIDRQARAALDTAADRFPSGTVSEKRVENGTPWRVLCEVAKAHKASLVVVGAHGYRAVERALGTTASRVANRAECSVLVVRQAKAADGRGPLGFERLLVAHDGSPRSAGVLASAQALAAPSAGRLILVRAVTVPTLLPIPARGLRPEDLEAALVKNAKADLDRIRGALPDRVPSEDVARAGAAWDVVLDVAKDKDATLISIGSHGYDALDRVLGSVAGRIVNLADRSVLIVRGSGVV